MKLLHIDGIDFPGWMLSVIRHPKTIMLEHRIPSVEAWNI